MQNSENLRRQAEDHPLVQDIEFSSWEEYILHLIHCRAYIEAAELAKGRRVLDWGCNVGYGMEILLRNAALVAGLDVSPRAAATAQERLRERAEVKLFDGEACPFSPASFDVVTSFQVVEHVSDYPSYFREILRVLRTGGLAVFTTPNATLRLDPGMNPWYEFHVREFTPAELSELLEGYFPRVEIRGLFGSEEPAAIEYRRLSRARQAARDLAGQKPLTRATKALVRRPVRGIRWLKDRLLGRGPGRNLTSDELAQFSTGDFFYRDDRLDQALDLMALCWTA